jgi:carbamoyl-phosphate synthase large subunit
MDALGDDGKVVACDINPYSAALSVAHYWAESLPISDPAHIKRMLDICQQFCIDILMTLNVDELTCLEACRSRFEMNGVRLIGAPKESIEMTRDKLASVRLCEQLGLGHPPTWMPQELSNEHHTVFPLIIKPRFGQSSQGIATIKNNTELNETLNRIPEEQASAFIIQELINGQEYGLDIINDLEGKYRGVLARRKLTMRGGETDIAQSISSDCFEKTARTLGEHLRHQGVMDIDLICRGEHLYLLDLNMRFGGGYAFSHLAGANVPAALMGWAQGKEVANSWLTARAGVAGARSSVIVPIDCDVK